MMGCDAAHGGAGQKTYRSDALPAVWVDRDPSFD